MQKIFLLIVIEQIFIVQIRFWFSAAYLLYFFIVCLIIFDFSRYAYRERQKVQLMHFSDKNSRLIKGQINKKPASYGYGVLLMNNSS